MGLVLAGLVIVLLAAGLARPFIGGAAFVVKAAGMTDMIEDAAAWMMRQPEFLARDGRIGMFGISFGGGLAIVASARPAIRNGVAFVMAFGGHAEHAEVDKASTAAAVWRLIHFWSKMLNE